MKRNRKIVFAVLLIISLAAMFLPIASIEDNSIPVIEEEIKTLEKRVKSAQDQLDRWEKGGKKTEEQLEQQRGNVRTAQENLDAAREKLKEHSSNADGMQVSLLPAPFGLNDIAARYTEQRRARDDAKEELDRQIKFKESSEKILQEAKDYLASNPQADLAAAQAEIAPAQAALDEAKAKLASLQETLGITVETVGAEEEEAPAESEPEETESESETEVTEVELIADVDPEMALLEAESEETTEEAVAPVIQETGNAEIDEQIALVNKLQAELIAKRNVAKAIEDKITNAEKSIRDRPSAIERAEKRIAELPAIIEQEQAKLDALQADRDALTEDELQVDMVVINAYKLYRPQVAAFNILVWVAFGLLLVALILPFLAGDKLVSKLYTFSSFAHLAGILIAAFVILRLGAFPIKEPYGNPQIKSWVAALILVPAIAAFICHVGYVRESKRSMIYVFCTFLSLLAIIPFWIMIVNGTRSSAQIQNSVSLIPGSNLAYNWNVLATKNFNVAIGFKNSAIIAFSSTILSVYFSAMTAYGFKVYQFKGNKFLYAVVLAIIMIPGQVVGTGFFMFMYQIGLYDNFIPLIIPSIAAAATVFFFRQYLEANFQVSLVEAARIDGCGEFKTFNKIVLPIMLPAMATMGIMAVIGSWNNYLTPLMLLSDAGKKTLPMMVKELRGDIYRTEFGSIYLGLSLTALPLIIVYFAFSKYIIAGVALGGVKE